MHDDLKRRILFFTLPVLIAAASHAILLAAFGDAGVGLGAGIITAVAAFFISFRYLDDRGAIIMDDHVFKPSIGLAFGAMSAGLVWPAAIPGMIGAMLILFGSFMGVSCFTPYLDLSTAITTREKQASMAAMATQMALLMLALSSGNVIVPTAIAGTTLVIALCVRFWRVEMPLTDNAFFQQ